MGQERSRIRAETVRNAGTETEIGDGSHTFATCWSWGHTSVASRGRVAGSPFCSCGQNGGPATRTATH